MSDTATPTAEIITFKLPASDKARLEELAALEDRSVSWILRRLVAAFIEEQAA